MEYDEARQYYDHPTPMQLDIIGDLIEKLSGENLDKIFRPTPNGWSDNLDFWLTNWGRANDLIAMLEETIGGS